MLSLRLLSVVLLSIAMNLESGILTAREGPEKLRMVFRAKTGVFVSGTIEEPKGFDVEIANSFFAWHKSRKGRELSYDVDYVDTLNELLHRAEAGQCDLAIGSVTATEEREKSVDFSVPYLPVRIVVFAPEGKLVGDDIAVALAGKKVGAIQGSTHVTKLVELQSEVPGLSTKTDYPTAEALFAALLEDSPEIDAAVSDLTHYWVLKKTEKISLIGALGEEQGLAFVFPEGSHLVDLVNEYLEFFTHSSVYFTLVRRYFGQEADVMIKMAREK